MSKKRVLERISDFKRALDRLKESLELDVENDIVVDGVIKRFEFCYELAWKTMKAYIEYVGIIAPKNPREVFREAFAMELIIDGDEFINMLKDRNLSVHTYDEETAHMIYENIKEKYYAILAELCEKLESAEL
ncbi:MAG: nucleotidyltransferase [Alkaliphilus sp.]|nr:MAG: nucleotidyltransferase [Alkaliphilus sp.]